MMFSSYRSRLLFGALGVCAFALAAPVRLSAHVKWFTHFSYADKPLNLAEALTPTFFGLALLSVAAVAVLAVLDIRLQQTDWFAKLDARLAGLKQHSENIMRIGTGTVLLLSWQDDAMLVPELNILAEWVGWYQFGLAFLLLFRKTTPLAGLGLIALYVFGIVEFGILHMLDYPLYCGAGFYLLAVRSPRELLRKWALPVLFCAVGFSLCWVALEKVIYPQWGLYVLHHQPQLSLGFPLDFFLLASAFVEFTLGYLVIIGLMQRPVALVISIVFFMTTLTFGKVEVIGHTLVHAILIVLLLEGHNTTIPSPLRFIKKIPLRIAAAGLCFALLLFLLLLPYAESAWAAYERNSHYSHLQSRQVEMSGPDASALNLRLSPDPMGGYNLEIEATNFRFAPEKAGMEHVPGEGHAHLYINGVKMARMYHNWYHLTHLRPGRYEIIVTLNANDHRVYTIDGKAVKATHTLEVE